MTEISGISHMNRLSAFKLGSVGTSLRCVETKIAEDGGQKKKIYSVFFPV